MSAAARRDMQCQGIPDRSVVAEGETAHFPQGILAVQQLARGLGIVPTSVPTTRRAATICRQHFARPRPAPNASALARRRWPAASAAATAKRMVRAVLGYRPLVVRVTSTLTGFDASEAAPLQPTNGVRSRAVATVQGDRPRDAGPAVAVALAIAL